MLQDMIVPLHRSGLGCGEHGATHASLVDGLRKLYNVR